MVYKAVESGLPEVGEMGSVLAYQGYYDDPVNKKVKLDSKQTEAIKDTPAKSNEQIDQTKVPELEKVEVTVPVGTSSEYYENFGQDNSAYAYNYEDGNDAYVYKYDAATGNETAEITVISGKVGESGIKETTEKGGLVGLVAYGSDSDDD